MAKNKNLVITDVSPEHRQTFLDLTEAMHLSRGGLLALLMADANILNGGLSEAIPDHDAQIEWRELLVKRLFEYANN